MAQAQISRRSLMESLFLESCTSEVTRLIDQMHGITCSGCNDGVLNQLGHQCITTCESYPFGCYQDHNSRMESVKKAVSFLSGRSYTVFREMREILASKSIYSPICLKDFMDFIADPSCPCPFARLNWGKVHDIHRFCNLCF